MVEYNSNANVHFIGGSRSKNGRDRSSVSRNSGGGGRNSVDACSFFFFGSGCSGGYVVLFLEGRDYIGQVFVEEVVVIMLNDSIFFFTISFFLQKNLIITEKKLSEGTTKSCTKLLRKLINFLLLFPCLFIVPPAFF